LKDLAQIVGWDDQFRLYAPEPYAFHPYIENLPAGGVDRLYLPAINLQPLRRRGVYLT
jgi:hypothetical protein